MQTIVSTRSVMAFDMQRIAAASAPHGHRFRRHDHANSSGASGRDHRRLDVLIVGERRFHGSSDLSGVLNSINSAVGH